MCDLRTADKMSFGLYTAITSYYMHTCTTIIEYHAHALHCVMGWVRYTLDSKGTAYCYLHAWKPKFVYYFLYLHLTMHQAFEHQAMPRLNRELQCIQV